MERIYRFGIVKASCTVVSDVALQGGDLLTAAWLLWRIGSEV